MILYSVETLTHFRCTVCNKWWTIGDWKPLHNMTCPHCGFIHTQFNKASKIDADTD